MITQGKFHLSYSFEEAFLCLPYFLFLFLFSDIYSTYSNIFMIMSWTFLMLDNQKQDGQDRVVRSKNKLNTYIIIWLIEPEKIKILIGPTVLVSQSRSAGFENYWVKRND